MSLFIVITSAGQWSQTAASQIEKALCVMEGARTDSAIAELFKCNSEAQTRRKLEEFFFGRKPQETYLPQWMLPLEPNHALMIKTNPCIKKSKSSTSLVQNKTWEEGFLQRIFTKVKNKVALNRRQLETSAELLYFRPDLICHLARTLVNTVSDKDRNCIRWSILCLEAIDYLLRKAPEAAIDQVLKCFFVAVEASLYTEHPALQLKAANMFVEYTCLGYSSSHYVGAFDDLVTHLTNMALNHNSNREVRFRLRRRGIFALQAILNTAKQPEICDLLWDEGNTRKVTKVLLKNMENCQTYNPSPVAPTMLYEDFDSQSSTVAYECFSVYFTCVPIKHLLTANDAVLEYMDYNYLWISPDFPTFVFTRILDVVKEGGAHLVIAESMKHFQQMAQVVPSLQIGVVTTISRLMAAGARDGFSDVMEDTIGRMLDVLEEAASRSLQYSDMSWDPLRDNLQFALCTGVLNYVNNIPPKDRTFILQRIVTVAHTPRTLNRLTSQDDVVSIQRVFLGLASQVVNYDESFEIMPRPAVEILDCLLELSYSTEVEVRCLAQVNIQNYLDMTGNKRAFCDCSIEDGNVKLRTSEICEEDKAIIQQYGKRLFESLYNNVFYCNSNNDSLNSVYTTAALICVEFCSDYTAALALNFILAVQNKIESLEDNESHALRYSFVQKIAASLSALMKQTMLHLVPVRNVLDKENWAPHVTPDDATLLLKEETVRDVFLQSGLTQDVTELIGQPLSHIDAFDTAHPPSDKSSYSSLSNQSEPKICYLSSIVDCDEEAYSPTSTTI